MICNCIYDAIEDLQCQCKALTRQGQQALALGETEVAYGSFLEAFHVSRKLLSLPMGSPDMLNYIVNSCLNFVQYGEVQDGWQAMQQLDVAINDVQSIVVNKSYCRAVRGHALDSCMVLYQTLINELMQKENHLAAETAEVKFTTVWQQYAAELLCRH